MSPTLMRSRQVKPPSLSPWDDEDFYDQTPEPPPAQPRPAAAAMPMTHGDESEYPVPPQGLESPIEPPAENPYFAEPFETPMYTSAPNPMEDRFRDVMDKRTAHAGQRPNANDKQYARPWWQRLAMAAANGAAGYVNAGGRARAATISPDVVASRPKYDAAMEDWRTRGEELSAEAQALQMEDSLTRRRSEDEDRSRRIRSDQDRAAAYVANQRAQAERAARMPVPKSGPTFMNAPTGIFNTETRQIEPGTGPAPKPVDPEDEMKRILIDPKSTPAQRTEAQRNLAIMRKPGGSGGSGGGGGQPKRVPQSAFIAIENRKNDTLARAEREYRKAIADDSTVENSARAELEQRKRQAQLDYEAEIEAAGGSVAPRAPGPPPPSAPPSSSASRLLASPSVEILAPAPAARPRRPLTSYY